MTLQPDNLETKTQPSAEPKTRNPKPETRNLELDLLTTLLNHTERGAWAFALTNTVAVRDETVAAVKARLTIPCYEFTFSPEERDPLHYLDHLPAEAREQQAAIFFYDIERAFPEALGYLDLNREWFLPRPHSLIFWITEYARRELAVKAPNFWSRRHSVFDFSMREREPLLTLRGEMAGGDVQYEDIEDWTRKLRLYQGLLEEYLAEPEPDQETIAQLYYKVATLYYRRGYYSEAEENLKRKMVIEEELGDQAGLAATYNNIGLIHKARGDYDQALHFYQKDLAIAEELGDQAGLAKTYNDIGQLYDARGDYNQAFHFYQQSLEIAQELGDQAGLGAIYNNIGEIHRTRGDYERAIHFYQQSLGIAQELGDQVGLATTYNNIAAIHYARGGYDQALHFYQQSLAMEEKLGNRSGLATTYNNMAFVYLDRGDPAQAIAYLEKSLAIYEEIGEEANAATVRENLAAARAAAQEQ